MHTPKLTVITALLFLCVLAIASLPLSSEVTGATADADAPTALESAAQKAYESTLAAYEAGHADVEDVYTWSKRWMNAQRKPSQVDHLTRMENLHKRVAALHEAARRGGEVEKFYATQFFVAEAKTLRDAP